METETWRPFHAARWDWVDEQIEIFAASLDETLARHFSRPQSEGGSHFGAVLYGKTQVGKTTLILRMMGLEGPSANHIADVLRAGRELGMSSTARPTSYSWSSHEDRWEIKEPSQPVREMHTASVSQVLSEFRDSQGRPTREEGLLEIGIPSRFRSTSGPLVPPRILDLPGAHAANTEEREFAAKLIRKHVSAAQMVILVARANDVDTLFSGLIADMLELSMWMLVPERFRVIVTGTISDLAAQPGLLRDESASVEWLRDHLLAELKRGPGEWLLPDDPQLLRRIASVLYPLAYGRSWESLRRSQPGVFSRFEPVMQTFLAQLTGTVTSDVVEDARRVSMVHASRTLELAAHRELEVRQQQLAQSNQRLAALSQEHEQAKTRVERARRRRALARDLKQRINTARQFSFVNQHMAIDAERPDSGDGAIGLGARRGSVLGGHWGEVWKRWLRWDPVAVLLKKASTYPVDTSVATEKLFLREWACCEKCTNGVIQHVVLRRQPPSHCLDLQERAWEATQKEIAERMTAARRKWLKAVKEQLSAEGLLVDVAEIQLARAESAAAASGKALRLAQDECMTHEERVNSYTKNVEDAHRKAQTLYTMLDHGLGIEWSNHMACAALSRTDDERVGHVLAGIMALRQFDRMSIKADQV